MKRSKKEQFLFRVQQMCLSVCRIPGEIPIAIGASKSPMESQHPSQTGNFQFCSRQIFFWLFTAGNRASKSEKYLHILIYIHTGSYKMSLYVNWMCFNLQQMQRVAAKCILLDHKEFMSGRRNLKSALDGEHFKYAIRNFARMIKGSDVMQPLIAYWVSGLSFLC